MARAEQAKRNRKICKRIKAPTRKRKKHQNRLKETKAEKIN